MQFTQPDLYPLFHPRLALLLTDSLTALPRRPLRRRQMNALEPVEPQLAQRPRDRERESEVPRRGCVEERSRGLQFGADRQTIKSASSLHPQRDWVCV